MAVAWRVEAVVALKLAAVAAVGVVVEVVAALALLPSALAPTDDRLCRLPAKKLAQTGKFLTRRGVCSEAAGGTPTSIASPLWYTSAGTWGETTGPGTNREQGQHARTGVKNVRRGALPYL